MNNTIENLFNQFIDFEQKHNLFEKEIRGFTFWSHIRSDVYKKISQENGFMSLISNDNVSTLNKISFKNLWLGIIKSPLFIFKRSEYLILNSSRRSLINGKYKCIYTDYLNDELKGKAQNIEMRNDNDYLIPTYSKNVKYLFTFDLIGVAIVKLLRNRFRFSNIEQQKVREISLLFEKEFQIVSSYFYNQILESYLYYLSRKPFLNLMLNRIKPKVLFLTASYPIDKQLLIFLAQKKGIEVIELQHGVIGTMNIGYSIKLKKKIYGIPDKLLLYGDYWRRGINLPIEDKNILVSGFNYLDNSIKVNTEPVKKSNRKTILILSQWTVTKQIIELALQLSYSLDEMKYKVLIRFHPAEYKNWKMNYPQLKNSNVVINNNLDNTLYDNFLVSDYVIGSYTTALYEAIAFKKKVFVFAINELHTHVADLYKNNYAIKIESANDFMDLLKNNITLSDPDTLKEEMWFPSKEFCFDDIFNFESTRNN